MLGWEAKRLPHFAHEWSRRFRLQQIAQQIIPPKL